MCLAPHGRSTEYTGTAVIQSDHRQPVRRDAVVDRARRPARDTHLVLFTAKGQEQMIGGVMKIMFMTDASRRPRRT